MNIFVSVVNKKSDNYYTYFIVSPELKTGWTSMLNRKSQTYTYLYALNNALDEVVKQTNNKTINIYIDNEYIRKAIMFQWYNTWYKNGWINSKGGTIQHIELWKSLKDKLEHFNNVIVPSEIDVLSHPHMQACINTTTERVV